MIAKSALTHRNSLNQLGLEMLKCGTSNSQKHLWDLLWFAQIFQSLIDHSRIAKVLLAVLSLSIYEANLAVFSHHRLFCYQAYYTPTL